MQSEVRRVVLEHQQLDAEAATLRGLLDKGPDRLPIVFAALSTFANALAEHLLREHDVMETALTGRPKEARPTRGELDFELGALRWDWEECLSGWTEEAAASDWDRFADQLGALIVRIRRRIALETALLHR